MTSQTLYDHCTAIALVLVETLVLPNLTHLLLRVVEVGSLCKEHKTMHGLMVVKVGSLCKEDKTMHGPLMVKVGSLCKTTLYMD